MLSRTSAFLFRTETKLWSRSSMSTKSVTAASLGSRRHFASAVASSVEKDARDSRSFSVKRDFFVEETKDRVLGEVKTRLRDVEEVDVNIRSIWWLRMIGNNSKHSSLIRSSNTIYETILSHVSQPHILPIFGKTGSPEDAKNWYPLMILHVWLAFVRLRAIEGDGARLSDYLFSNFWTDAERRIAADLTNPFLLSKFAKELFNRYHGAILSYDEGLILGDTELAEALYRNIFESDADLDATKLLSAVQYVRGTLQILDWQETEPITKGVLYFGSPVV